MKFSAPFDRINLNNENVLIQYLSRSEPTAIGFHFTFEETRATKYWSLGFSCPTCSAKLRIELIHTSEKSATNLVYLLAKVI